MTDGMGSDMGIHENIRQMDSSRLLKLVGAEAESLKDSLCRCQQTVAMLASRGWPRA
jgi:hypothetical protein